MVGHHVMGLGAAAAAQCLADQAGRERRPGCGGRACLLACIPLTQGWGRVVRRMCGRRSGSGQLHGHRDTMTCTGASAERRLILRFRPGARSERSKPAHVQWDGAEMREVVCQAADIPKDRQKIAPSNGRCADYFELGWQDRKGAAREFRGPPLRTRGTSRYNPDELSFPWHPGEQVWFRVGTGSDEGRFLGALHGPGTRLREGSVGDGACTARGRA